MASCHTPSVSQEAIHDVSGLLLSILKIRHVHSSLVFKVSNAWMTNKMRGKDLYRSLCNYAFEHAKRPERRCCGPVAFQLRISIYGRDFSGAL